MKLYDGRETAAGSDAPGEASEPDRHRVGIAEYAVSTTGATLTTSGLGSCVGVALYDERAGVAGLVHVMLPSATGPGEEPAKFADTGTMLLVDELERAGASRRRLVAKMAGGSDMLDFSTGASIGDRNVQQVRRTLADCDVPIVGEDVGGEYGRSLRLDGDTGTLVIRRANRVETTL